MVWTRTGWTSFNDSVTEGLLARLRLPRQLAGFAPPCAARLSAQAIGLTDAEGRSCIYVPISQDGRVVDSEGYTFSPEDD